MKQFFLLPAALTGALTALAHISAPARAADSATPADARWSIAPVSAMHKLTATQPGVLEPFPARPAQLTAARGERENFQVVVTAGDAPLENLQVSSTALVSPLGYVLPAENISIFHERFVQAVQPSGNRRLEKLWWPDALVPLGWQPVKIAPHRSAAFWVSVRVPEATVAGRYYGTLEIENSAGAKQLFLGVDVQDIALPAPAMRATAALYYDVLRDWYTKNIGLQSDAEWAKTKRAYYDFLLNYRVNAYDLPVAPDDPAFAVYVKNPAVTAIRTPPLDSPDFAPFMAALKANGAESKAFYYRHDEPSPDQYDAIRTDAVKLHAAGVKQLVTAAPNDKLLKAVDIWCPNTGDALGLGHLDLDSLALARKRGEETWWYTMTVPRAPYPTWLLDDNASSVRLYGWQMARWGIYGFVYSMVHGWGPKPLEDLKSFAGSNGDGTLLYPGEQTGGRGPMPSIRLMLLRDAIEDYELLRMLTPAQRTAVTSGVVGDAPADRIDDNTKWESETYRDRLFQALQGQPVPPIMRARRQDAVIPITAAVRPHIADGVFTPGEWRADSEAKASFGRFSGDVVPPSKTTLFLQQQHGRLFVGLQARDSGTNEWCAVELGPEDASERWRFVVTSSGKTTVERHTTEGHFGVEGADWKGAFRTDGAGKTSFYEWSIPLDLVADAGMPFRLNVLRRVDDAAREAKYTVCAWPDDGDVTRMPLARRASEAAKPVNGPKVDHPKPALSK